MSACTLSVYTTLYLLLQRYLTSFRVLELKELLKTHGQSTKGRKPELFQRANELLRLGSPKLQTKIREIYEKANGTRRQLNYNRAAQKNSPVKSGNLVVKNPSRPYIVHPDVRFKAHPFFSKLETIIRPTALSKDMYVYNIYSYYSPYWNSGGGPRCPCNPCSISVTLCLVHFTSEH